MAIGLWLSIFSLYAGAEQPHISVISFINQNSPIEQLIKNVSKQTIFSQCELLLINTNSSDQLYSIVSAYAKDNPKIRYIATHGITNNSTLLNLAIQHAKGDYITIAIPEESHNPLIFEQYAHTLDTDSTIDLVYANICIRYEPNTPYDTNNNTWYRVNKAEFSPSMLHYNLPGNQCMWRKSMHEKYGYFDTSYPYFGTLEFWNRAVSKGSLFKKVADISGNCYLPYGSPKKIFNSYEDNERGYQEMKSIREKYHSLWGLASKNLPEKPFVIITASYKNKDWYKRNLDSVFNQEYTNYRIIYVDDNSPDSTGDLVEAHTKQQQQEHKMTLIKNTERVGALANIYKAAQLCRKDEIIVLLDGDDWLAHEYVLAHLNEVYQDPHVWITYGQFLWFPFSLEGFSHNTPSDVILNNSFRSAAWSATHLRTFYAALFQKIKKEDLMYGDRFYPMTWDLAIMYPMMEMAGFHSKFIPEILYVYNSENSINDHKVDIGLQGNCGRDILNRPTYNNLSSLF